MTIDHICCNQPNVHISDDNEIDKYFDNRIPIKGILAFPTFYIHEILEVLTYILIRTFMFSVVCQLFSS